jgi:hypothetical protein
MQDIFDVARVVFALAFYISAYILPPTLVLSGLVRLALHWHGSWKLALAALLAATPQTLLLVTDAANSTIFRSLTLLTLLGAGLHIKAMHRQHGAQRIALEISVFAVVLAYTLTHISWIVG